MKLNCVIQNKINWIQYWNYDRHFCTGRREAVKAKKMIPQKIQIFQSAKKLKGTLGVSEVYQTSGHNTNSHTKLKNKYAV